ncbi:MAG: hypothetical protein JW769_02810 [Parachlamydiales bacterium]|nr:hypothetical protein [Parachlamydiales bacterium]
MRLFFGFSVEAPWPDSFPSGKIIFPEFRHLTVAFIPEYSGKVEELVSLVPSFPFSLGKVGLFHRCVFLPKREMRVVAWEGRWLDGGEEVTDWQNRLIAKLVEKKIIENLQRETLFHMTISRGKFSPIEWEKSFFPLPMMITHIQLYESLGNSHYRILWKHPFIRPFEGREHTADMAYIIRGRDLKEIFHHAFIALAFSFPMLSSYYKPMPSRSSLEEIIIDLNTIVADVDREIGIGIKAVSFHGQLQKKNDRFFEWEMVIDV